MNKAEMREQLWGTVLAFDALRQRLVTSCFLAEVQDFAQSTPGFQDFTEEMKKLVARCETLLEGMGEKERI